MPYKDISAELINAHDIRNDFYILSMMATDVGTVIIGDWTMTQDGGIILLINNDIRIVLGDNSLLFNMVEGGDCLEVMKYVDVDMIGNVCVLSRGRFSSVLYDDDLAVVGRDVFDIYTEYMAPIVALALRCISFK